MISIGGQHYIVFDEKTGEILSDTANDKLGITRIRVHCPRCNKSITKAALRDLSGCMDCFLKS